MSLDQVFILSAGLGSRLRPWTEERAKPSIPFLGVPLGIHPLVHTLESLPLQRLVFNTHHLPQTVRDTFVRSTGLAKKIIQSHEPQLLGSFGGLFQAFQSGLFDSTQDLLVMNGDEVFLPKEPLFLNGFLDSHHKTRADISFLVTPKSDPSSEKGGLWVDPDQSVVHARYGDKIKFPDNNAFHFLGVYLINLNGLSQINPKNKVLDLIDDFLLPGLGNGSLKAKAHVIDSNYYETGNIESFQSSESHLQGLSHDTHVLAWRHRLVTLQSLIRA